MQEQCYEHAEQVIPCSTALEQQPKEADPGCQIMGGNKHCARYTACVTLSYRGRLLLLR